MILNKTTVGLLDLNILVDIRDHFTVVLHEDETRDGAKKKIIRSKLISYIKMTELK